MTFHKSNAPDAPKTEIADDNSDALLGYRYFWFRADRHDGGYGPDAQDLAWLTALLDPLRQTFTDTGVRHRTP
jgi:hypothetical protein